MLFVLAEVASAHIFDALDLFVVLLLERLSVRTAFLGDLEHVGLQRFRFLVHLTGHVVLQVCDGGGERIAVLEGNLLEGFNLVDVVDLAVLHLATQLLAHLSHILGNGLANLVHARA